MRFRIIGVLAFPLFLLATSLWTLQAIGYDSYHPNDTGGCYQCHSGFAGRGPLHDDVHVGSANMGGSCTYCHTSVGDNPKTWVSGSYNGSSTPAYSCNGCHTGPGLRAHHAAAGVPADNDGLVCATCHNDDPTPDPESTVPFYYTLSNVNVKDPCVTSKASGGEDYDGDGEGLDNDGNQLYDEADPACSVPVEPSTWGTIKSLYGPVS